MASDSVFMKVALSDLESVFEGLSSVVDVGGGTGTTAKIICLPGDANLSFVSGDMHKSIPHAAEFNAKERSKEEWKQQFQKAGFTDYQMFPYWALGPLIVLHP
ncbi:hypothetical protein K1719_012119 [Acacia pycnantha]|nr:hypothetical protein K1719_012119 [Acacia pycnantha]